MWTIPGRLVAGKQRDGESCKILSSTLTNTSFVSRVSFCGVDTNPPDWSGLHQKDEPRSRLVHKAVANGCTEFTEGLIANGANLHLAGTDYGYTDERETPTSLAIRSSPAFFRLKRALTGAGIDLTSFVQDEIETGVLGGLGWSSRTLLELFNLELEASGFLKDEKCAMCGGFLIRDCIVEPKWLHRIEEIRLHDAQASGMSSRSSATNSVEDFLGTGLPTGSSHNQNNKDAEPTDEAGEDISEVDSSQDGYSEHSEAEDDGES